MEAYKGKAANYLRRHLNNPFWVLDLPVHATAETVERKGELLLSMLALGMAEATQFNTPLGLQERTPELVREALSELRNPDQRLLHEWLMHLVGMAIHTLKSQGGGQGTPRSGTGNTSAQKEVSFLFVFWLILLIVIYLIRQWHIDGVPVVPAGGVIIFFISGLYCIPEWLAWRFCRPLRLFFLGRFFVGFFSGNSERFVTLMRISQKKISQYPPPFAPDDWATATQALLWEIRGNARRADALLQAFELCPPGMKPSRILRQYAFEELAWHAAKRGDWEAVRLRASQGVGRGVRLFRCLAEMHLQHHVNRMVLLLAWMFSPLRLRAWPFVRPLLGRCVDNEMQMPGPEQAPDKGPRRTHIDLLFKASQGQPIAMEEVFLLAKKWDEQWSCYKKEDHLRRGMELRTRDLLTITQTIEERVLDELEELAAAANGDLPQEVIAKTTDTDRSYVVRLGQRIRNRLYDDMNRAQALIKFENKQPLSEDELQTYWENWLHMQATVSKLCRILGPDELGTLWYSGLRSTASNGAAGIYNACGKRASWIAIIMFYWVATIARQLGDEQAETYNRNNMTFSGYTVPGRFWSSLFRVKNKGINYRAPDRP